jgi:hypothetical protein
MSGIVAGVVNATMPRRASWSGSEMMRVPTSGLSSSATAIASIEATYSSRS